MDDGILDIALLPAWSPSSVKAAFTAVGAVNRPLLRELLSAHGMPGLDLRRRHAGARRGYDFKMFSTSRAPCRTATTVSGVLAGSYTIR